MTDVCSMPSRVIDPKKTIPDNKYTRLLSRQPALKKLLNAVGPLGYDIPVWPSINDAVLYAVIGQMLSLSASNSIIKHLYKYVGSSSSILIWAQNNCWKKGPVRGVSQRKRKALKEWFSYAKMNKNRWKEWAVMPLDQYRNEVCGIWGFGRWAADMIGIFHLARMDIWPETDTGIQKTCKLVFGTNNHDVIKKIIRGCETATALYLWELVNRDMLNKF
jgi:3-methyladenine DNA glycosylase/8-oxoguanine DNA glycosylase